MATEFGLRVVRGPDAGQVLPLTIGEHVIGRQVGSQVLLADGLASRQHARLVIEAGRAWIVDLGSSNGTRVNGAAIGGWQLLNPGDLIGIGESELRLEQVAAQPGAPPIGPLGASLLPPGFTLNRRFRLDGLIGQGGFASVFRATDLVLKRRVAVKVLHAALAGDAGGRDFLGRFAAEAQAVAALDHQHILGIFDYGEDAGTVYLVMPYIEGGTLHDRLRDRGRLTPEDAAVYLRQAARALDYAHRRSLVHRDIKPQNMLLRAEDDRLLLADFGIAKVLSGASTNSGTAAIGTMAYMAPEQFQGQVGHATDIYALGCVLFQLLTGQAPFNGTTEQVIFGHLAGPVPRLAERGAAAMPAAVQEVVERALAKRPDDRYRSAGELATAFDAAIASGERLPPAVDSEPQPPPLEERVVEVRQSAPADDVVRVVKVPVEPLQEKSGWQPVQIPRGVKVAAVALILVLALAGAAVLLSRRQASPAGTAAIQGAPAEVTFIGHTAAVQSVGWSADGKIVASGGDDGVVRLWYSETQSQATLNGHSGGVRAVAWQPSGRLLASAGDDGTVRLWYADSLAQSILNGHSGPVRALTWAPDGKTLASAGDDGTVRLWYPDSLAQVMLAGHTGAVRSLAWGRTGRLLASGGEDGTVRLWYPDSRAQSVLRGHTGAVRTLAWAANDRALASGGDDGTVRLWYPDSLAQSVLNGHGGPVRSVAWSPDGATLASGGDDRTVRLWRADGTPAPGVIGEAGRIAALAWSPDSARLAAATDDRTLRVWGRDGRALKTFVGHSGQIASIAWSPDGARLASCSEDRTVRLWR